MPFNSSVVERLPAYLSRFIAEQNYDRYTPQEHASWRYIMLRSRDFFSKHALPIYNEGVKATGIPLDRIPRVTEMNAALQEFGWGAVPVCGFIPPAAFLEFQARSVLPIAVDMRTIDHISYTPAPDIVHEAAGHAPIVADPEYRDYLQRYAAMAAKGIISQEDLDVYEAIRLLSDSKENPDISVEQIRQAQEHLNAATARVSFVSEATKIARMAWWTVEYGLLGPLKNPKIYGAGLLSSVAESEHCLSDNVVKKRFSVDCVNQTYDITEPQPQLFVAESIPHLVDVLQEFEATLSFRCGGIQGLREGERAKTVVTVVVGSAAVAVSGIIAAVEEVAGSVNFFKMTGPCQISHQEKQLPDQGRHRHPDGFSTPLGRWSCAPERDPQSFTDGELQKFALAPGKRAVLEYTSGFRIEGRLESLVRREGKLLLMTWSECTVRRGEKIYFDPAWGEFDGLVGESVVSVCGGPADKENFGPYAMGNASTSPARTSAFTPEEKERLQLFADIQAARNSHVSPAVLEELARRSLSHHWLAQLEVFELCQKQGTMGDMLLKNLRELSSKGSADTRELIQRGLEVVQTLS